MGLIDDILALNAWAASGGADAGARLAATRARYGAGRAAWSDWAAAMSALRERLPFALLRRGEARALWERCAAVDLAALRDGDGDVFAELYPFPGDVLAAPATPLRSVSMTGARIGGAVRLAGVAFAGALRLDRAQVGGGVEAQAAQFRSGANFEETCVAGPWRADKARFAGLAWFRAATFEAAAGFDAAQFEGELGFHTVRAAGRVSFRDAAFADTASFQRSRFRRGCDFTGARFSAARHVGDAEGALIGLDPSDDATARRA